MSAEQTQQQKKQSSTLPPALSKPTTEEPTPEPDLIPELKGEPGTQPPPHEAQENQPKEEKEPVAKQELPVQLPMSDVKIVSPADEGSEANHDVPESRKEEQKSSTEQLGKEVPTLPRVRSQESLKSGCPPTTEDFMPVQPLPPVETQKHQQTKQPPQWPSK